MDPIIGIIVILILIVAVVILTIRPTLQSRKMVQLDKRGLESYFQGQVEQAIEYYEQALSWTLSICI